MKKGVTINLSNKLFYLLLCVVVLFISAGVVYAYNSSPANPAVMGHSLSEVGIPTCSNGQILAYSNGNLVCANPTTGSSSGSTTTTSNCTLGDYISRSSNDFAGPHTLYNGYSTDYYMDYVGGS